MATCPKCDEEVDLDEYDVDKGDIVSCPECGASLEVTSVSPLEFETLDDDDEDDDEDEDDELEDDELDEDDDEEQDEDWDE